MKRWREKIWWSKSEKVLLLYQVKVWEKSKPKCHFRVWNQNSIQFQTCQICNWFASEFTGHKHKSILLTSTFHSEISSKPVGCECQECFTTVKENDEEISHYCNIQLLMNESFTWEQSRLFKWRNSLNSMLRGPQAASNNSPNAFCFSISSGQLLINTMTPKSIVHKSQVQLESKLLILLELHRYIRLHIEF